LSAFLPGQTPIDAYGNGGFRFAEMSHRGSILALPSGMHAWRPDEPLTVKNFARVLAERALIEILLLGTGQAIVRPQKPVRDAITQAGIGLDIMDTGAAVRTYNILLAERRRVAAALVAVDTVR
jgi:uncharacterized protein